MAPEPSDPPTHFSLAGLSLKLDTAADLTPHITPLLSNGTTITSLDLSGNTLGVPACSHLATVLPTLTNLKTANLADIFTSRLLSEIPPALSSLLTSLLPLQNLHTIDLSDNAFGLNTVSPLVSFLEQHTPLQHLILQNNGLGPAAGSQVADALTALAARKAEARIQSHAEGLARGVATPDLETVICGRNRLESGSTKAWSRTLRAHAHGLRTVKMVQNGIRQDGIALLLREGLSACGGLEVLDLQDNTVTLTGARALAETVPQWPRLQELGVGDCLVGARGAVLVFEALGSSTGADGGLEVLRAQYNDIDAKGVAALLGAAKVGLTGLRRVELNGNKFSEDDASVEGLRMLLEERRGAAAAITTGKEDAAEGEWGLDELSDLEEESDGEEEEDGPEGEDSEEELEVKDEGAEKEAKREEVLRDADEAEGMQVAQKEDEDVGALADELNKTHVK